MWTLGYFVFLRSSTVGLVGVLNWPAVRVLTGMFCMLLSGQMRMPISTASEILLPVIVMIFLALLRDANGISDVPDSKWGYAPSRVLRYLDPATRRT